MKIAVIGADWGQKSDWFGSLPFDSSEVDTISGTVVRAAKKHGMAVSGHEFVVNMVHAMGTRK